MNTIVKRQLIRRKRTRSKVYGTSQRPRLSVFISNKHIVAQIINDESMQTLVYVTTATKNLPGSLTQKAVIVGEQIAKAANSKKISEVVFDRGHRLYHGRMNALANAARKGGLKF